MANTEETKMEENVEQVKSEVPAQTEESETPEETVEKNENKEAEEKTVYTLPGDMTDDEMEALARLFEKRRVHSASKTEADEIYKNERIVSSGEKVKTDKDKRKEEYNMLMMASRSVPFKKILYGVLDGVIEDESTNQFCMTAQVDGTEGLFVIKIPVSQLYEMNFEKLKNDPNALQHIKSDLTSRIGSHVGFCIYDVDEVKGYAYASRLYAMEIEARAHYIRKAGDGVPEIVNGCLVKAEVISTMRDRLIVNVMGADAVIMSKELSHMALGPINEEFSVGDTFIVRVGNIEQVKYKVPYGKTVYTYTLIHLIASKRAAEPDPATKYYDQFNVGDKCYGEIKNITTTGVYVRLKGKMDCLCRIPNIGKPAIGQKCIVDIYLKRDDEKWLYGNIVRL